MVVLSSYCPDGEKMIGMFGMGDKNAKWKTIGEIDLNETEPTEAKWDKIPIEQSSRKRMSVEEFVEDIRK